MSPGATWILRPTGGEKDRRPSRKSPAGEREDFQISRSIKGSEVAGGLEINEETETGPQRVSVSVWGGAGHC